jgi:hypothetical protein
MTNEYGAKLDRNYYAPSILDTAPGLCFGCFHQTDTARHEIFFGNGRRVKSKRLGLWVNLCPRCHTIAHNELKYNLYLKQTAQEAAMDIYGWDIEKCIDELGKNYMEEE